MSVRPLFALVLACTLSAQVNPGYPKTLKLASCKVVQVLNIKKSTMHQTDEPCLALYYLTNIPFSDMKSLYYEVEEVWNVFQPMAEKEEVLAAVVNANEPASGFLQTSKGAGWAWKRGMDGKWHAPAKGDQGLVPK
jgi:hypothetical protein